VVDACEDLEVTTSTIESISCDFCKKELICELAMPAVYALELSPINVNRNKSNTQYCVAVRKPETLHFCNKKCLAEWANT